MAISDKSKISKSNIPQKVKLDKYIIRIGIIIIISFIVTGGSIFGTLVEIVTIAIGIAILILFPRLRRALFSKPWLLALIVVILALLVLVTSYIR